MTKWIKTNASSILTGVFALAVLGACGLRGGLERPPPIFSADKPEPEIVFTPAAEEPEEETGPQLNEFGGEIPEAAPTTPVISGPLEDTDDEQA